MAKHRLPSRLLLMLMLIVRIAFDWRSRRPPTAPRRILIAHHLLLGDTLMLTPLLAKLREQFPQAELVMTTPTAFVGLYAHRPYGVDAIAYDPKDLRTLMALWRHRGFDLALLPADNRYSLLAWALGARWTVGFADDRRSYKSWFVDSVIAYSAVPRTWSDTVTELVPGPPPRPYRQSDWRAPSCRPFARPPEPYCVLHVGASSSLRHWEPEKWARLADWLQGRGFHVVWSAGKNEVELVRAADPEGAHLSLAGELDLPQMWHLLASARLLVVPDTGIAHLARVVGVATVTLFGPGSVALFGPGEFWRKAPFAAVTLDDFPCRDQRVHFRRTVEWVRRCSRFPGPLPHQCSAPRCMQAIDVESVQQAVEQVLQPAPRGVRSR